MFLSADFPSIRVEIFHSFSESESRWREAQERCACYGFQTFEWLSTWQETVGAAEAVEPRIIHIVDASENTLMLLPLGIHRRRGLSFLSFLGGRITDYHAPIIRPDFASALDAAALSRLMTLIVEKLPQVDVIAFDKMPSLIEGVSNPFIELPGAKHANDAFAATLSETFAEFKKRHKAKFFADASRKLRRLSDIAPTRFWIAASPEEASSVLDAMIRQKRRKYRETGFPDLFAKPSYSAFFSRLIERHLTTGLIHASALTVGETIVATHCGMIFRDRLYWLMPSYEAGEWARYSVGRVLMQSLLEWSISRGLKVFDFTLGDEAYKSLWADHSLPLYECNIGLTGQGKAYLTMQFVRGRIKEEAKKIEWVRRLATIWRRGLNSYRSRSAEEAQPSASEEAET